MESFVSCLVEHFSQISSKSSSFSYYSFNKSNPMISLCKVINNYTFLPNASRTLLLIPHLLPQASHWNTQPIFFEKKIIHNMVAFVGCLVKHFSQISLKSSSFSYYSFKQSNTMISHCKVSNNCTLLLNALRTLLLILDLCCIAKLNSQCINLPTVHAFC